METTITEGQNMAQPKAKRTPAQDGFAWMDFSCDGCGGPTRTPAPRPETDNRAVFCRRCRMVGLQPTVVAPAMIVGVLA
jgi:hypothetical protein